MTRSRRRSPSGSRSSAATSHQRRHPGRRRRTSSSGNSRTEGAGWAQTRPAPLGASGPYSATPSRASTARETRPGAPFVRTALGLLERGPAVDGGERGGRVEVVRRGPRGSPRRGRRRAARRAGTRPRASGRGARRRPGGPGRSTPSRRGSGGRAGRAGSRPGRRRRGAAADTKTRLPLDLDIFSPSSATMPAWTYALAKGYSPVSDLGVRGAHLVVREGEVGAAALHVEAHAEVVEGDGDALDVPAGPAAAERAAVPARLALTGGHPQHRVEGVLLARAVGVAAALGGQQPHRLGVQAGHLAEVRVGLHGEVDVALELVRGARVPQPLDERHDAGYRLDGADVVLRGQHPQGGHVLAEERGLALGELGPVVAVADRRARGAGRRRRSRSGRSEPAAWCRATRAERGRTRCRSPRDRCGSRRTA